MAVAVAALTPADGDLGVLANTPAYCELTDTSDLDPDLVEIIVNGVSHTIALGNLEMWHDKTITGGAVVDDFLDLSFRTTGRWYDGESESVDVEVIYNAASLQTNTFTTASAEDLGVRSEVYWAAWETSPEWRNGQADGYAYVLDLAPSLVRADGWWKCSEPLTGQMDGRYWVAHVFIVDAPCAGIVAIPAITDGPSAGVVEGWARTDGPSAGIVEGWLRVDGPSAGIVGIPVTLDGVLAGIVGHETVTEGPAAGVVYACNRLNTLEVDVMSEDTAAALAALGITVT